jgi:hypothetical protein
MEIHFIHHPVTLWHPAILTAVVVPGLVAWVVSRSVTRLALRMRVRWQQVLLLSAAAPVVVTLVALLTLLLFEVVWRRTEEPNVFADFGYFNRFALLVPMVIVFVSAARELTRANAKAAGLKVGAV